jgi:hypothetical protein
MTIDVDNGTRDDIRWRNAPIPPFAHHCEPWSPSGPIQRCACGARRDLAHATPAWSERNSRRAERVRYYTENEYPWLAAQNQMLKSADGIREIKGMLDSNRNLAGVIVQSLGTRRAQLVFDEPVEAALNERLLAEAQETLRVALEVGCAHMLVRRGWVDQPTTQAHKVDRLCLIIVDLPEEVDYGDGRCLPRDE